MSDNLETKSDAELNELFAVDVAGWKRVDPYPDDAECGLIGRWLPPPIKTTTEDDTGVIIAVGQTVRFKFIGWLGLPMPEYCTDANAVLPFIHAFGLRKLPSGDPYYFDAKSPICEEQGWMLRLVYAHHDGDVVSETTEAPTFARACVLALLRAKQPK